MRLMKLLNKIPALWNNTTVFIIGGGPSLNGLDLSPLHSQRCVGVNNSFRLGSWIDVCWSTDSRWLEWNKEDLRKFAGLKLSGIPKREAGPFGDLGVLRVRRAAGQKTGISTDPGEIVWNLNSGASAINLAVHLGAQRIVLVGFDMKVAEDGNHNWHNDHRHRPPDNIYEKRFMSAFAPIAADLGKLGIECLNANPESAIEEFPKIHLTDLF